MTARTASGLRSLFSVSSPNPRVVGLQLACSCLLWAATAALLSLLACWQQTWPWTEPPLIGSLFFAEYGGYLTPEFFSWIEMTRDSMLIFLVALPMTIGLVGNLVMPQCLDTERLALGRWNRMFFWLLWVAFFGMVGAFVLAGWRTPGDAWAQVLFTAATALAALCWLVMAISQLATVSAWCRQARSIEKLPLSVGGLSVANVVLVVALSLLLLVQAMQMLDGLTGTSFLKLEHTVPVAVPENGLMRQVGIFSITSLSQRIPILYLILLPGIGLAFDRIHDRGSGNEADRSILYAMVAVGVLALAAACQSLLSFGGESVSTSGPLLFPSRLIILPLAVVVGRFALAEKTRTGRLQASSTMAMAFVLTIATGAFFSVLLAVEPLGSYLRATLAADAHRICLLFFGGILVSGMVLYDQMERDPDRRFMKTVVGANGILLCIGVPAIYWIWFLLGASGLPAKVADPQQFQSLVSPAALQVALFVLLTVVLGVQLIIAAVLMLTAPMGAARRRK